MSRIIIEAEKVLFDQQITRIRSTGNPTVTEAISQTAYFMAHEVNAKAIVCLTSSGSTARFIARHRPHVPVYAFTDDKRILGQLALSWGTKGFYIPFQSDTDKGIELVHNLLKEQGLAATGDIVVMTAGMPLPMKGRTNMLHVSIL